MQRDGILRMIWMPFPVVALVIALLLALLLGSTAQSPVSVATWRGLERAVKDGVPHIVLSDHIDARTFPSTCTHQGCSPSSSTALQPLSTLRSVRGNCSQPVKQRSSDDPLIPDLLQLQPGQCVIYTNQVLLNFYDKDNPFEVWLDNLFVRVDRLSQHKLAETQALTFNYGSSWLTNVTMQGDEGLCVAMKLSFNAFVYAEDSTFSGFTAGKGPVARAEHNSSLFLNNCRILDNTSESRGAVYLGKGSRTSGPSHVAVAGGAHSGNTPQPLLAKHSAGSSAFATPTVDVYDQSSKSVEAAESLSEMPLRLFLSGEDEVFVRLRQEATSVATPDQTLGATNSGAARAEFPQDPQQEPGAMDAETDDRRSSGHNSLSPGVVAAITVVSLGVLGLFVGVALRMMHRRRTARAAQRAAQHDVKAPSGAAGRAECFAVGDGSGVKSFSGTEARECSSGFMTTSNQINPVSSDLPMHHDADASSHRVPSLPGYSPSSHAKFSPSSEAFIPAHSPSAASLQGRRTPPYPGSAAGVPAEPTPAVAPGGDPSSHTAAAGTLLVANCHQFPNQGDSIASSSPPLVPASPEMHGEHAPAGTLSSESQCAVAPSQASTVASGVHAVLLPTPKLPRDVQHSKGAVSLHHGVVGGNHGGGEVATGVLVVEGRVAGTTNRKHADFHEEHTVITTFDASTPPTRGNAIESVLGASCSNPDTEAGILEEIEDLEEALDALHETGRKFLGRYKILSAVERRGGGQGVVQFAQLVESSELVAIKFFNRIESFRREADLYESPIFKKLMPATLAVVDNADGSLRLGKFEFPPCIVIKKGQSLNEFASSNVADFITIFQTLMHVVRAVNVMHAMGYVHRDIKPGNILRRPGQHDWTLIDFGCAARIGTMAKISYSLGYTAPEVILAVERGQREMHADAALDMWAVGVVAMELLTRRRAFLRGTQRSQVFSAIAGRTPLPWEPGPPGDLEDRLKPLRGLRQTILQCLSRDPSQRPSAAMLLTAWDHSFDALQTQGVSTHDPSSHPQPAPAFPTSSGSHATSSHNECMSGIGSVLQSLPSSSMPPQSSQRGSGVSRGASSSTPSHTPLEPSIPGTRFLSSAAGSFSSRGGASGSHRGGAPMQAGVYSTPASTEHVTAGARASVPALPDFNAPREGMEASTDRITTHAPPTDAITTERSL